MSIIEESLRKLRESDKQVKKGRFSGLNEYWGPSFEDEYDDEDEEHVDPSEIHMGDLVDFGSYGKLYVVRDRGDDTFWVTDRQEDRYDKDCSGWSIRQTFAKKILDRAVESLKESVASDIMKELKQAYPQLHIKTDRRSKGSDYAADGLYLDFVNISELIKSGDINQDKFEKFLRYLNNKYITDKDFIVNTKNYGVHNWIFIPEKDLSEGKEKDERIKHLKQLHNIEPNDLTDKEKKELKDAGALDEDYLEDDYKAIATSLTNGWYHGTTYDGRHWGLSVNGEDGEQFSPKFADAIAREISFPVEDGNLSYNGLDVIFYKDNVEDIDEEQLRKDLATVDCSEADIEAFIKDEIEYIEFFINYDIDLEEYEEDEEPEEESLKESKDLKEMKGDKKIESLVKKIAKECNDYINSPSKDAWTDRTVEKIVELSKEIEKIHADQFKDESLNENASKNKNSIVITLENIEKYYSNIHGNLYFKYPEDKEYQIMDGFDLDECKQALKNGVKFIFIPGSQTNFEDTGMSEKDIHDLSWDDMKKLGIDESKQLKEGETNDNGIITIDNTDKKELLLPPYEIEYWLTQEARDQGYGEVFSDFNENDLDEALDSADNIFYDTMNAAAVEVNNKNGDIVFGLYNEGDDEPDLPKEVTIDAETMSELGIVPNETDNDEESEILSNYLSDTYGFLHKGFNYDDEGDHINIYNIEWDTSESLKEGGPGSGDHRTAAQRKNAQYDKIWQDKKDEDKKMADFLIKKGYTPEQVKKLTDDDKLNKEIHDKFHDEYWPPKKEAKEEGLIIYDDKDRTMIIPPRVCNEIKTAKDLNDFYAYMEQGWILPEDADEKAEPEDPWTYLFEADADRIDELVADIDYVRGEYDEKNVERIIKDADKNVKEFIEKEHEFIIESLNEDFIRLNKEKDLHYTNPEEDLEKAISDYLAKKYGEVKEFRYIDNGETVKVSLKEELKESKNLKEDKKFVKGFYEKVDEYTVDVYSEEDAWDYVESIDDEYWTPLTEVVDFNAEENQATIRETHNSYTDITEAKDDSIGSTSTVRELLDMWWNSVRVSGEKIVGNEAILYKDCYDGSYELDEDHNPYGEKILDMKVDVSSEWDRDADGYPIIRVELIEK